MRRYFISVDSGIYKEIHALIQRMKNFRGTGNTYDISILRSYLQLVLASSSKEKQLQIDLFERSVTPIDWFSIFVWCGSSGAERYYYAGWRDDYRFG